MIWPPIATPPSAKTICVITLALFVVVFGAGATLAQTNQVSFTATATGTITGVTKLPGGLTQINFNGSGSATHLGNFTGALTRLQDNQGNFGSTAVMVGANGKDSIFLSISGQFQGKSGGDKCVVTSTNLHRHRRGRRVRQRHGQRNAPDAVRPMRKYRQWDVYGNDLTAELELRGNLA